MTIAKGMSNYRAEREIILQGFREQLEVLEHSQQAQEENIKAKLYDIIADKLIDDEEKETLKSPWLKILDDLEEQHIRIRRSIFIGIYSFWEISLKIICDCGNVDTGKVEKGSAGNKQHKDYRYKNRLGASDYLLKIFGENFPESVKLINSNIRELRNYLVHGSMNSNRKAVIEDLITTRPYYKIKALDGEYCFANYDGLGLILDTFEQELNGIEKVINKHDY